MPIPTRRVLRNLSTEQSLLNVNNCLDPDEGETHTQTSHVWWSPSPLELVFDFGQETTYTITGFQFWNYFGEQYDVDQIDMLFFDKKGVQLASSQQTIFPSTGQNAAGVNGNDIIAERIVLVPINGVASISATLIGTNGQIDFQNMLFLGFKD